MIPLIMKSAKDLKNLIEEAYNECIESAPEQHGPSAARGRIQEGLYCPRTFDGWSCWNETEAGEVAYAQCPHFITGFDPQRMAHKMCEKDGTWFRHPETNVSWSNYTTCIDIDDLAMRRTINIVNITGYTISLVALLISICIFFYFRSLRCTRITIHKNLFVSFVINNSMWLIWYAVLETPKVLMANEIGCQILHVVLQYFLVSNYFWMFCEGLYLHTILVVAFVDKQSIMKWLYIVGWGIPVILTLIYAAVRSSYESETVHCWINDSPFYLILTAPVCVSMLANLIFLVSIVKVLVTKLRAVNSSDTDQTKKAVRATIILIPLLGLHFLVTPFRPEPGDSAEHIYGVVSAFVTSFQGLCVALLFCYCNGEIITLVKKKYHQRLSVRSGYPTWATSTTLAYSSRADSLRQSSSPRQKSTKRQGTTNNHICLADITPPQNKSLKRSKSKEKKKQTNGFSRNV